ncbi:hypothetical protein BY996DRAFT_6489715 [Phakopsora pachyrhizi]|nr:hypothetical protein BY996DRAFT_6489715 [Phakopsora pachyrhizi]
MNGTKRSSSNYSQDGSGGGAATVSVTGGTVTGTIPLVSFTLPLPIHSHSDHLHQHFHGLNIPKPVYYTGETTIVAATASDKSNTDGGPLYNGYYSEVARTTKDEVTPGHMVEQLYGNGLLSVPAVGAKDGGGKANTREFLDYTDTQNQDHSLGPLQTSQGLLRLSCSSH